MKRLNVSMKALLVILGLLVASFLVGRYTGSHEPVVHANHAEAGEITSWTCSMHPQIALPEPGKCPICGMDLIPRKSAGGEDLGERMMSMSKAAMKLAEVRTAPVERKFVDIEIPMVGIVDYDETRVKTISAWTDGRLDRLFVDYTGIPVKKGDHLVEIYSPELYTAQEELLQAIRADRELGGSGNESLRRTGAATVDAVREKLKLLGLNEDQISSIELQESPLARTEITSPIGGIVIQKNAKEGMYVKTGTPIYTVADLSMLWVQLDAYESDLAWIKYGQDVEIRTGAFGDKIFPGWISFIDPVLDPKTRTVKVRVVVENKSGLLRPNMFVKATVKARVGEEDVVLTSSLEGKWICPMHPEVVKDEAGECDVCGMDLVEAAELGYASGEEVKKPVVVPATAVLITGKRAIVYREVHGKERPTFEGVEIEVGPRAGDYYIVRSGLEEGDDVVVNGNFKIDSALQLFAKASMMSPEKMPDMDEKSVSVNGEFLKQLSPVYESYLDAQRALASDNAGDALKSLASLKAELGAIDMTLLEGDGHKRWMELLKEFNASLAHVEHISEIAEVRELFGRLSAVMVVLEQTVGQPGGVSLYQVFCPMAFDNKGASWLQLGNDVMNPYFGESMLHCGEVQKVYGQEAGEGKDNDAR